MNGINTKTSKHLELWYMGTAQKKEKYSYILSIFTLRDFGFATATVEYSRH